jgi:hypothetical protein
MLNDRSGHFNQSSRKPCFSLWRVLGFKVLRQERSSAFYYYHSKLEFNIERGQHEAHISTQQPETGQQAWFSPPDEHR